MESSIVQCLISRSDVSEVQLQYCIYRGKRNKYTSICFSPQGLLADLLQMCDGEPLHEPWGECSRVHRPALNSV